ncbi:hypothetical protein BU14_0889s0004 [Porphyra umbilicalis]|uniref:Major facilitator superfamily (MFS) profile domain-containing protein n=1 Tax=Porphyra umbilicalis TaxID=2786 RepID=A0A1X6NP66_PORUM|nr:hypothetical protein BU14_0889s0004 [Porphyra umbilicalis]|eukprot:OSX70133.1 hypothetical protein BU14_0889s0004 [Porphyra umbilicalis]
MSTFFGLIGGWAIDYLGVRLSLVLGAVLGSIARFILAFSRSRRTAMLVLYTLLPASDACGIPIMTIGVKRFTNSSNRTFAFSFFYSMMNLAALTAGPLVDAARQLAGGGVQYTGTILWWHDVDISLSPLRLVVFSGGVATLLMLTVVFTGVREVEVGDDGVVREFAPNRDTPMEQTMAVLRSEAFWRLSLFTFLLVGVRLVFRHMDATMPKVLVRSFGPSAPFGLIYSINPFLIIFLVPVVGLLTRRVDSYTMILVGATISGLSPFWMSLGVSYWFTILFMVTLSVGEAIYSPRVYEYTMNVSSRGSEGLFSSLASAPLFSVKLVVGAMSGILLTDYCPSFGHCNSQRLWSIVGATSLLSPILMVFLRSCIESRGSEDRDSDGGAAMAAAAASKPAALDAGGGPTEATALLPRSRADVYPTTTAEAVRVDVASLDQGKAVFAKSRPMAIPDEG